MTEKSLVVQHNQLIESRYKLPLIEQRLVRFLISMIEPDDEDFKQYVLHVSELATLLEIKSGDIYRAIDKAVDSLMDTPIKFSDGDDKVKTRWLSSSRYQTKKGIALLRFDPELKPYLLNMKERFTSYQFVNVMKLKHIHSIRIYELLKQYERIGKRKFSVDDLKYTLAIGDNEYKQYRDFRRWVLKVSQVELNEKTDISFEFIEERQGRAVKFIEFIIRPNSNYKEKTDETITETNILEIPKPENSKNEYVEKLVDMGVTRFIADQLVNEFDSERIDRAITYTKEKNGTLKDPAAFVVVAIQKDFTDSKTKEKEKKVEALQLQLDQEKLKKQWQKIKSQYEAWKKETAETVLFEMPVESVENYRQQFIASLSNNTVMLGAFRKNKDTEKRHFLLYMYQHLTLDSLETWAQKNAIDLSVFPTEIQNKS